MLPQSQAAVSKAASAPVVGVEPLSRASQKRWPMALSILGAVGASLVLWAGIFWLIGAVMGSFR
jgi:hypothetical protein